MESFYENPVLNNESDLIRFFQYAIEYRNNHKDESTKVAMFVFDTTFQDNLSFSLPKYLDDVRNEFGALEAPGSAPDNEDQEAFEDKLWDRLHLIIEKNSK